MVLRRVNWWDEYVRPWQPRQRFLVGAGEAGPSSPTTLAAPGRFRALCAEEGSPTSRPLVPNNPSVETDRHVSSGDSGAQSRLSEAQPEEVVAAAGPEVSTATGVAPPALLLAAGSFWQRAGRLHFDRIGP